MLRIACSRIHNIYDIVDPIQDAVWIRNELFEFGFEQLEQEVRYAYNRGCSAPTLSRDSIAYDKKTFWLSVK